MNNDNFENQELNNDVQNQNNEQNLPQGEQFSQPSQNDEELQGGPQHNQSPKHQQPPMQQGFNPQQQQQGFGQPPMQQGFNPQQQQQGFGQPPMQQGFNPQQQQQGFEQPPQVFNPYATSQYNVKAQGNGLLKIGGILSIIYSALFLLVAVFIFSDNGAFTEAFTEGFQEGFGRGYNPIDLQSLLNIVGVAPLVSGGVLLAQGIIFIVFSNRIDSSTLTLVVSIISLVIAVIFFLLFMLAQFGFITSLIATILPPGLALIGAIMNKGQRTQQNVQMPTDNIPPYNGQ